MVINSHLFSSICVSNVVFVFNRNVAGPAVKSHFGGIGMNLLKHSMLSIVLIVYLLKGQCFSNVLLLSSDTVGHLMQWVHLKKLV